jgi:hypothetical protein
MLAELRRCWLPRWAQRAAPYESDSEQLFGGYEDDLAGDALPGGVFFDPSVYEVLMLSDGFSFSGFPDTKDTSSDGGVAVDFGADILVNRFCRLVRGIFNAGEKLAFASEATVGIDGDEGGARSRSSALVSLASTARLQARSRAMM